MSERKFYLSQHEKEIVETLRTFGAQEVHISQWPMFRRIEAAGKINLSEPHGKYDHYRTAKLIPTGE